MTDNEKLKDIYYKCREWRHSNGWDEKPPISWWIQRLEDVMTEIAEHMIGDNK